MNRPPFDENMVIQYLLGELSEDERLQFEERAFADQELLQNIRAVENDLFDEYARGELSGDARRRFEERFLASSAGRRKVEFARDLASVMSESPATDACAQPSRLSGPAPPRKSFLAFIRGWRPALALSLAGVALLLVIGFLFVTQTTRRRAQQAQHQSTQPPQQEMTPQPQTLAQGGDAAAPPAQPQREPPGEKPKRQAQPPATVATLILAPGLSRGSETLPQLVIPPGTGQAQLQVGLESGDDYKHFVMELRTARGQAVWTQNNLQAHTTRAGRAVVVRLPASLLNTGKYELTLRGVNDEKAIEDVGDFYFNVVKK